MRGIALALWAGFAGPHLCADTGTGAEQRLCHDHPIVLAVPIAPGLSDSEKRLVCGDSDPQAANTDHVKFDNAWKTLPPAQAQYNMKNFLQERGYYHPAF